MNSVKLIEINLAAHEKDFNANPIDTKGV
jgi:hypothetical protein